MTHRPNKSTNNEIKHLPVYSTFKLEESHILDKLYNTNKEPIFPISNNILENDFKNYRKKELKQPVMVLNITVESHKRNCFGPE